MKVFYQAPDVEEISEYFKDVGSVITIGNFDGCHEGHQALIMQCRSLASKGPYKSMALTFDPHPRAFFKPQEKLDSLFTLEQKLRAFSELGLDACLVQKFDAAFAGLTADEFFRGFLQEKLHCKGIVVGENFCFGKNREGDNDYLRKACDRDSLELRIMEPSTHADQPTSSSRLRQELKEGSIEQVSAMLGRPYMIEGLVVRGRQLGRTIAIPTLNLGDSTQLKPRAGVYAGYVCLDQDSGKHPIFPHADLKAIYPAAISIGMKPSVSDEMIVNIEAHAIDVELPFDSNYGRRMGLYFCHYIREEEKFESVEELTKQIRRDIDEARRLLASFDLNSKTLLQTKM